MESYACPLSDKTQHIEEEERNIQDEMSWQTFKEK